MLVAAPVVPAGAQRLEVHGRRAWALLAPLFADAVDAMELRLLVARLTAMALPRDLDEPTSAAPKEAYGC